MGPKLDWLSDGNGAGLSDGKDECTPAIRNRVAAATQSDCACRHSSSNWQKRWGARQSRDGVRGRDGVLSSFLGGRSAVSSFKLESAVSCLAVASVVCSGEPNKLYGSQMWTYRRWLIRVYLGLDYETPAGAITT